MEIVELPGLAKQLDLVLGLIFVIITGARGMWVFGHVYTSAIQDRNEWRTLALSGLSLTDRSVSAMEKK